jgi:hypothetical protein
MFFLLNQFSGLFFYIACATRPLWHWQLHKIQMSSCYLARILVALATKYREPKSNKKSKTEPKSTDTE